MKKLFLILALAAAGLTVNAQNVKTDVPSNAKEAFKKKYPDAQNVNWERDGKDYKAEFTKENKEYEVVYDNTGKWIYTEIDKVTEKELPSKVKDGITKTEYKSWKIKEVEKIETPNKTIFKVGVNSGMKDQDLYFDKEGKKVEEKETKMLMKEES